MKTLDALAAWESATVQNLAPLLHENVAEVLWSHILSLRSTKDLETFAASVRADVVSAERRVTELVEHAIASLHALPDEDPIAEPVPVSSPIAKAPAAPAVTE